MRLRDIVIMGVVFSMLITAYAGYVAEFTTEYKPNVTVKFNQTYSKLTAFKNETETMQAALNTSEVSSLGSAFLWATGAWNVLIMVFRSVDILRVIIGDFVEDFGIPSWVATAVLTIILVIVIFEIVGAIFKRKL